MKLASSAFENQGIIPAKHTCDGDDISPALTISEVPATAKSLVLLMDDPDVPKHLRADGMWNHWIVFNIPAVISEIMEGHEPPGIQGRGTSNNLEYHGPCPPDREHRYFFKLYALDAELDLDEGVSKTEVETAMTGHVIKRAELVGLYERNT